MNSSRSKPLLIALCLLSACIHAQVIYNAYAAVTSFSGTTFTVNNVNETNHTFAVNENLIIMQMQDDVIGTNTTNASTFGDLSAINKVGLWEVAQVASLTRSSGTLQTVTLAGTLANSYTVGPNSSLQLITFHKLSTTAFTSSANITGAAWNGTVGGVIALEVGTIFTLGHTISANSLGFRGGSKNNVEFASTSCDANYVMAIGNKWAGKGEGIYKNTNANFTGARGKILNAGGGGQDENSGGGGGGNYTAGGTGGPGYNATSTGCSPGIGGLGGISLSASISGSRIFMGGGGGGGHENNSVGTVGGNGGGIILLKTGTLTTTGSCGSVTISANGASVAPAGNDGSGGGGGGGSIVLKVNTFSIASTCSLVISSNGGNGGTTSATPTHGGGGGGGQGVVLYSIAQPTTNMITLTNNGSGGCNESTCATSAGNASGTSGSGVFSGATTPLPIEMKSFSVSKEQNHSVLRWTTASETNSSYFEIQRTVDGSNYKVLGSVSSKAGGGNSNTELNYIFTDLDPEQGINYYRMKLVDLDHSFKYSTIVSLSYGTVLRPGDFQIFPNPSSGQFFIKLNNGGASEQALELILSDLSGRTLIQKKMYLEAAQPYAAFEQLSPGYYILRIMHSSGDFFVKLIVN